VRKLAGIILKKSVINLELFALNVMVQSIIVLRLDGVGCVLGRGEEDVEA